MHEEKIRLFIEGEEAKIDPSTQYSIISLKHHKND